MTWIPRWRFSLSFISLALALSLAGCGGSSPTPRGQAALLGDDAGALSSNVYDLIAWDNALIHGKVISPVSFQEMTTSNGFQIPGGGSCGFGLALWAFNHRPIIWHNGQIGGFTAETAVFLDSGFAVVVLTNDQDADPMLLSSASRVRFAIPGSSPDIADRYAYFRHHPVQFGSLDFPW
jgi:hypothetical protein